MGTSEGKMCQLEASGKASRNVALGRASGGEGAGAGAGGAAGLAVAVPVVRRGGDVTKGKTTKKATGSPLGKATCKEDWKRRRGSHCGTVRAQPFPAGHLQPANADKEASPRLTPACHFLVPSLPQNQSPGLPSSPGSLQIPRELLRLV